MDPGGRVPERLSEASLRRRRKHQERRGSHFLRGPVPLDWLAFANALPGKATAVALAIWFAAGCQKKRHDLKICQSLLERLGISRSAGYRGLSALETAGLLRVDRHRGRCPRVTILNRRNQRAECE
jgi:hypothetical protein